MKRGNYWRCTIFIDGINSGSLGLGVWTNQLSLPAPNVTLSEALPFPQLPKSLFPIMFCFKNKLPKCKSRPNSVQHSTVACSNSKELIMVFGNSQYCSAINNKQQHCHWLLLQLQATVQRSRLASSGEVLTYNRMVAYNRCVLPVSSLTGAEGRREQKPSAVVLRY